ncbi:putative ATP-binding region, ATPase domain protein [metagenome]|uniref:Putative ATP-binding region, ATPase domain protein n=1 Tax=metagenome TaxID=256318 RepID=A0A2P2BW43_9ZZZZ
MTLLRKQTRYIGVSGLARVFALLSIAVPVLWNSLEPDALVGVLGLALVWMGSLTVAGLFKIPRWVVLMVEAGLIACVVGASLPRTLLLAPALAVTPFVGGLSRGVRGVIETLTVQLGAVSLTAALMGWRPDPSQGSAIFTWLLAGLGFGLLASFARSLQETDKDELTPYRDARSLITKLLDLTGELSEGLDAVTISQNVIAEAREELPFVGAVVYVRRHDELTPLLQSAEHAGLDTGSRELLVERVWSTAAPAVQGGEIAFPLRNDSGVVAVVAAGLSSELVSRLPVQATLEALSVRFRPEALQLDTALLFDAVRAEATAEERRRLAREVHDGVAQDIASLGYMVDDLEESATSPTQVELFGILRREITGVVAELRRSVFSLRNDASTVGSLGESIGALARHVTTVAGIPVHLTLDEGSSRLRWEVEAELLRITQEAMNNAVKHARADNIWVHCTVNAPSAEVVVRDDGRGLGDLRHDSHGVRIMHERASLIGATVTLENGSQGGVVMRVVVSFAPISTGELQQSLLP